MASYGWLLDPKRCIECRACEAACKQWNGVPTGVGVRYRKVHVHESGVFPKVAMQALSLACNHCENALCMKACPNKSISRKENTGAVVINSETCLGCRQCQQFCPYQAPQFNEQTQRMQKCTFCFDRLEEGLPPACVAVCPTQALQFGEWENIEPLGVPQVANFTTPRTTSPRIRFINGGFQTKPMA